MKFTWRPCLLLELHRMNDLHAEGPSSAGGETLRMHLSLFKNHARMCTVATSTADHTTASFKPTVTNALPCMVYSTKHPNTILDRSNDRQQAEYNNHSLCDANTGRPERVKLGDRTRLQVVMLQSRSIECERETTRCSGIAVAHRRNEWAKLNTHDC